MLHNNAIIRDLTEEAPRSKIEEEGKVSKRKQNKGKNNMFEEIGRQYRGRTCFQKVVTVSGRKCGGYHN